MGFSARDVREIMAEVDQKTWENADGLIDWHEFEPVAMRLMRTIGCTVAARAPKKKIRPESTSSGYFDTLPDTSRRSRPMNETGVQYTLSRVFHDATGDDDGAGGVRRTKDAFARTLRFAQTAWRKPR